MGCDFAIFGSQPDEEIQNQCVEFIKTLQDLRAPTKRAVYESKKRYLLANTWRIETPPTGTIRNVLEGMGPIDWCEGMAQSFRDDLESLEIAWQSTLADGMEDSKVASFYVTLEKLSQFEYSCDIVRHEPQGWKLPDEVAAQWAEWRLHDAVFSPVALHGVALTEPGGYYFFIVFDRSAPGGSLVSVELPGVVPCGGVDHAYHDYGLAGLNEFKERLDDKLHLWPGTQTRFTYGDAMLYVFCKALKLRFIPNLLQFADAHEDVYNHLMDELGITAKLRDASLDELPTITAESIEKVQQAFLALPRKQRRSPADFLGAL